MTMAPALLRPHRLFRLGKARHMAVGAEALPRRTYLAALAGVLAAALALQLGLFGMGFHRVSFDDSARSLMALNLSLANSIEYFIWPPFYHYLGRNE